MALTYGAVIFGFNLGTWFSVGMIALSGAAILYTTQQALRRYPEGAYVAAAVQLFSSIMTSSASLGAGDHSRIFFPQSILR